MYRNQKSVKWGKWKRLALRHGRRKWDVTLPRWGRRGCTRCAALVALRCQRTAGVVGHRSQPIELALFPCVTVEELGDLRHGDLDGGGMGAALHLRIHIAVDEQDGLTLQLFVWVIAGADSGGGGRDSADAFRRVGVYWLAAGKASAKHGRGADRIRLFRQSGPEMLVLSNASAKP
jgi:hypothetical protein